MAGKSKKTAHGDFSGSRDILTDRPRISFIEPDQIIPDFSFQEEDQDTLDNARDEVDELITDYGLLVEEADALSREIDARSKNIVINLSDKHDAHIIDSLERLVSDEQVQQSLSAEARLAIKKNQIPYELYSHCIKHIGKHSLDNFHPQDPTEITRAETDPFRTNFGASGLASGLKRPELDDTNQIIEPVNLKDFKQEMLLELLKLLAPGINALAVKKIKELVF